VSRPTIFNPELGERICGHIASGDSIRKVGARADMPDEKTIRRWLYNPSPEYNAFRTEFARATELRASGYAEEIVEIADDPKLAADQKRVMVDARKWVACKLLPKQYGDAVTVKGDKNNPLQVRTEKDLTEAELLAIATGGLREQD
jgi:hypothetical protein